MKVFIFGRGGFVGQHLSHYLSSQGIDVVGVSSSDLYGICPLTGILSNQFSIPPETNTVIYLAQSPFYRQTPEKANHLLNVNLVSAVQVAEIARQSKVKRFIYTSTGNVYSPSFLPLSENDSLNRTNWYALSKIHAEEALSLFKNDMDIMIIRLFGVYGVGQTDKLIPNLLNSILHGNKIFVDRNLQDPQDVNGLKLSLIYIEDLVKIISQCIYIDKTGINTINISSHEIISVRNIVKHIGNILDQHIEVEVRDQHRNSNLIADTNLLQRKLNHIFIPFEQGIRLVVEQELQKAVRNNFFGTNIISK